MFHVKQSSAPDDMVHDFSALSLTLATPLPAAPLTELATWLAPAAHQLGLTNYRTPLDLAEHLMAPALRLLSPALRPLLLSPALDFGAGSGAIGLSLALAAPELEVLLADRRRRVVEFLDLAIRRHRLANAQALLVDLSDPPPEWQNRCGSVLIRAFGPTAQALDHATAWLRPQGTMVLWHQPPAPAPPDGSTLLVTEATNLPALLLTIYRRA